MPHREYIVDGVAWPSVTEILGDAPKPWLEQWRQKWGVLADRKLEISGRIGDAFHAAAERLVKNEVVREPLTGRVFRMLERFEEWHINEGFTPQATETHVVSTKHKYQGTFDAIGRDNDTGADLALYDWKTSAGIYDDMKLQLAAYALAYYEQTGIKINEGVIVQVSKKKPLHKLTVKRYKLTPALTRQFLRRLKKYNEARA